jgi:hypothetical protein
LKPIGDNAYRGTPPAIAYALPKRCLSDEVAPYLAPPSVSASSLLRAGSDRFFQKLIFDLFTISAGIERVRVHFASKAGISGPQYSLLRAVASLQRKQGVSIGIVAEHLYVTSTFVTAQSVRLCGVGFEKERGYNGPASLAAFTDPEGGASGGPDRRRD